MRKPKSNNHRTKPAEYCKEGRGAGRAALLLIIIIIIIMVMMVIIMVVVVMYILCFHPSSYSM
jgi:flagellar basal body-associated protein FliL